LAETSKVGKKSFPWFLLSVILHRISVGVVTMNKQCFRPYGGETKEFTVTLQNEALTFKAVDEAEQVVGIVQQPQDILILVVAGLMSHFISLVPSIYIHMLSILSILTAGMEEQSATSFSEPLQVTSN
jgi:hypothetical protein